jgi:small-conductance mechanosensitive channel
MNSITIFGMEISAWIYAPVVYFLWVSVLLILKRMFFKRIRRIAERTKTRLDDVFLYALSLPLTLLIFVSGIWILEKISPQIRDAELARYFFIALKATAIVAVIIFLDRLLRGLIRTYSDKVDVLKTSRGVAQGIVRTIVIALGLLILLDSFGVSITPLVASLGIGSLAVALALQPTLENFFSGVQIVIDKPIQVGQFVKLESGEEGYVQKIGWRSSWVRVLPNNTVVIPNKVLVSSRILNYYYPEREMSVLVQVGVHYNSDLEHVEKVTVEVGEEVMKTVKGGVPEFKPFIRYHTFNNSSIDFSVILRCREFIDGYLIKHEFIKRLHKRYAAEGIVIPFPICAVNYSQEKALDTKGS